VTTTTHRAVRLLGVLLVLAGAALVLASFRFLDWYEISTRNGADYSPDNVTFSTLHSSADQLGGAGSATAYFGWLAWILLIAVILTGVAANLPLGPADPLRVAGFVLAVIGVAATYLAIAQLHDAQVAAGAQKHSVFHNSTWGLWAAFAGFLLAAAGAALGPRSVVK
jgi:uncharacterized protein YjeT (DUF2065 family)